MPHTLTVTLNSYDEAGNVVDTSTQDVTSGDASNIIDRAAELLIRVRENRNNGKPGLHDLATNALDELEEMLDSADVI